MEGIIRARGVKAVRDPHLAVQLGVELAASVRLSVDQNRRQTEAGSVRDLRDEETQAVTRMKRKLRKV